MVEIFEIGNDIAGALIVLGLIGYVLRRLTGFSFGGPGMIECVLLLAVALGATSKYMLGQATTFNLITASLALVGFVYYATKDHTGSGQPNHD